MTLPWPSSFGVHRRGCEQHVSYRMLTLAGWPEGCSLYEQHEGMKERPSRCARLSAHPGRFWLKACFSQLGLLRPKV